MPDGDWLVIVMSLGEQTWTHGLIPMIEPEIVTEIISRISDLALVISPEGKVLTVLENPSFRGPQGLRAWEGSQIDQFLTVESIPKFESRLADFLDGKKAVLPVELNHKATQTDREFPIRYSFHEIGSDGAVLMLGSDLRSTAEMQQQLVAAQMALERDYESQREHDLRFRVLLASTEEVTVFISVNDGEIFDCNGAAATLFGRARADLIGSSFAQELDKADADIIGRLVAAGSEQTTLPVTASTRRGGRALHLTPILFRTGAGQMLLCRIATADGRGGQSNTFQGTLTEFFEKGIDAIAFVNAAGNILSANDSFCSLADVTHAGSVRGRSMAEFLSRGSVDLGVLLENAQRSGAMRLYATRMLTEHGGERPVEMSATLLKAGEQPVFALVLRDATRMDVIRTPAPQVTDVDMQSVIELIGNQSLRDIVAKTTDVVEKMCIETAVEMTSNNRVAAAEMLGLSRQSLYVKLRKYGLINKD